LKLSSKRFDEDEILEMREKFDTECIKIVDKLRQSGKLTDSMSEYDRAKILFEYVAYNVKYDDTEQDNSFTGYGAVIDSLAVCQGYTAFFHKLCDIEDIETEGVAGYIIETGESHVWTKIKLDGNWVFCDVTFSDPLPDVIGFCDLSYFAKTYEEIMLDRTL
jgi:transglutaminase/protease-like cytokinesis protein 3